ncbi:PolC-type DNA polymerase III [Streptomyces roseus]|uniref:3'-5' exonuclease n=1 Tax=Streptomyces TaxID=1883 RepID=UPI0007660E69|nr:MULTISPECIES: 3'-5' exonuclease [Streptomyces]
MTVLMDNLRGTTFVVIDFEALTPAGRPAEPTEVAALALVVRDGRLVEDGRFESLIQPSAEVPITPRDLVHGMSEAALRRAPGPAAVLAGLDQCLTAPPYRLVAQHASTEAGLIARQRQHCPVLGSTPFLDTLKMAKQVIRGMSSYGLDALLRYYGIAQPPGRHRAMPDVEVTADLFGRLLRDGAVAGHWSTLLDLDAAAGLRPKPETSVDVSVQESLFGVQEA